MRKFLARPSSSAWQFSDSNHRTKYQRTQSKTKKKLGFCSLLWVHTKVVQKIKIICRFFGKFEFFFQRFKKGVGFFEEFEKVSKRILTSNKKYFWKGRLYLNAFDFKILILWRHRRAPDSSSTMLCRDLHLFGSSSLISMCFDFLVLREPLEFITVQMEDSRFDFAEMNDVPLNLDVVSSFYFGFSPQFG